MARGAGVRGWGGSRQRLIELVEERERDQGATRHLRASLSRPPPRSDPHKMSVPALTTSSGQPVYAPNLVHNSQSLYYAKSTTACIAGAVAGILGLTNLAGFAFFLLSSFGVGGAYALANCGARPGRYFLKPSEPLVAGTLGNCFSFILFWTLFYSLVYIYD